MDVFDAMETCIAMRYLKEDLVPKGDLERLVHAATRASSPANSQGWEFIILDERDLKTEIGIAVAAAMGPLMDALPEAEDGTKQRMYDGTQHLLKNFAKVPAWILVCGRLNYPPEDPSEAMMYSTIFPAAQNLIVAARAMGLGTTFTSFHTTVEGVIQKKLDLPDDVIPCVMVAVGYPDRQFMPVRRRPTRDVIHWNGW